MFQGIEVRATVSSHRERGFLAVVSVLLRLGGRRQVQKRQKFHDQTSIFLFENPTNYGLKEILTPQSVGQWS